VAAGLVEHPFALLEGRAMPDVLAVSAGQQGDPVTLVVADEAHDPALHAANLVIDRLGT
jgi:hypothetical protein